MNKSSFAKSICLVLLTIAVFPQAAHAYIDPSVGSYVLQLVFGFIFAAFYVCQEFWASLKRDGIMKALEKRLEKSDLDTISGSWRLQSSQSLP